MNDHGINKIVTLLSFGPEGWGDEIAWGLFVSVSLALVTLPPGLIVGIAVALMKQSSERSLRLAGNIYTTIFRGLPELLTLFLIFYGVQIVIQKLTNLFFPGTTVEINGFVAGVIALGVVFSSYASEVFLAAFRAIPRGQYECARALGLSAFVTMFFVILPQVIRLALPGLSNLWLVLIKDTALTSVIGISELLRQGSIAARVTREPFIFFSVICLIYLLIAIISSFGIRGIERKFRTER